MEHNDKGDISDDFMFKEPTPLTRIEQSYLCHTHNG
jgi:hypothetical protein